MRQALPGPFPRSSLRGQTPEGDGVTEGQIALICTNHRCAHYEVPRLARRQIVGEGIYLAAHYQCACGHELWSPSWPAR